MITDDTVTPVRDHLLEAATGGAAVLAHYRRRAELGRAPERSSHALLRAIARANFALRQAGSGP